jgi:hypothetical protein
MKKQPAKKRRGKSTALGTNPFDELIPPPADPPADRPADPPGDPADPPAERPKAQQTFFLTVALIEGLKDAADALQGPPHRLKLSGLAERVLQEELTRLQAEHNSGQPFPKRPGKLRTGPSA